MQNVQFKLHVFILILDRIYIEIEHTTHFQTAQCLHDSPRERKQDVLFIAEKAGYFQASRVRAPPHL